jgi:hypothetical protein
MGVPLLLTPAAALAPETVSALASLNAHTVYVIGGTAAVSANVISQLQGLGYTVPTAISGADRYATSAAVATAEAGSAPIGTVGGLKTAILATGANFPDALAAGSAAYFAHIPILLTDPNTLSTAVSTALTSLGIQHVIIMGGTSAVSSAVETAVQALMVNGVAITTQRVSGADRFATAADMAQLDISANFSGGLSMPATNIVLASGLNFPDALVAAEFKAPIVLDDSLPAASTTFLSTNAALITTITAIGGTAAVSDADLAAAASAVSPSAGAATFTAVAGGTSFVATFAAPVNTLSTANFLWNNGPLPAGATVNQTGPASYLITLNALPPAAQPNVFKPGDVISINTANPPTAVSNGAAVPASSFTVPANVAPSVVNVNFFVTSGAGIPAISVQFSKPVNIPAAAAPAPAGVNCVCGGVSTDLTTANASAVSQDDTTFTWEGPTIARIVGTDTLTINTTTTDLTGPLPAPGVALTGRSVYAPTTNTVAPSIGSVINTVVNQAPLTTQEGALDASAAFGQAAGTFTITAKVGGPADGALGSAFVIYTTFPAAGQTAVSVTTSTTAAGLLAGQTAVIISVPGGPPAANTVYGSGISLAAALNANPVFNAIFVANSTGTAAVPATGPAAPAAPAAVGSLAGGVSYYAESAILSKPVVPTANLTNAANWTVSSGATVVAVTLNNNATPQVVTVTVQAGPTPPGIGAGTPTATSYQNVVVPGTTTLAFTNAAAPVQDFSGNAMATQTVTVS